MYNFDREVNRLGTDSIKWEHQNSFGQKSGLLPFWIADTDFASVPEILEAIKKRCDHPIIGYSDPADSVFEAIQSWYQRRNGWKVPADQILMGTTVISGIGFSLLTFTNPGDRILVFTPVYDPFFHIIRNTDRTLVELPMDEKDREYTLDFEKVEQEMKNGVKAVIFCSPHNPVGKVWTAQEVETLVNLCVKYNVFLLSDEIHGDLTLFDTPFVTAGKFPQIHDRLIVYSAISKTFNMAGLTSSYMLIPNKENYEKLKEKLDGFWLFGPSELAYPAIEAAYTHGEGWLEEQKTYLEGNVELVYRYIEEHMPDIRVMKTKGTFLMWLDCSVLGLSSGEMTERLAKDYGVALGNGASYCPSSEGFMRLNIGCTRQTLTKGLEAIKQFYEDIRGGNKSE